MAHNPYHIVRTKRQLANQRRRRLLESAGATTANFPAAADWNFGTDGDAALYSLTDGSGGVGGTGLDPFLDVISPIDRRCTGLDFSDDGTACIGIAYDGILASFSLSTAYDLSTAVQTGSSKTGLTLGTNCRFSENGDYVTWMAATDTLYIAPLATNWVVQSTDTTSAATLTKTELMGYSASHDPLHCMHPDGTGVWSYGQVSAGVYTLVWMPLSTPYDFSTNGTPVDDATNYTNIASTPASGSLHANEDGTKVVLFGATVPESYVEIDLTTAFDPSAGITFTQNTEILGSDQTQGYEQLAFSRDLQTLFSYDNLAMTVLKKWGQV